jgi:tRNA 2-thiouridine synthesizing protein A
VDLAFATAAISGRENFKANRRENQYILSVRSNSRTRQRLSVTEHENGVIEGSCLMNDDILDLTGLKCPLPALMTKRRLTAAASGAEITVVTDDPMASVDVPFMCQTEGFLVIAVEKNGTEARMKLRKP